MRWYKPTKKEAQGADLQELTRRAKLMDEILALLGPNISMETLEQVRDELRGISQETQKPDPEATQRPYTMESEETVEKYRTKPGTQVKEPIRPGTQQWDPMTPKQKLDVERSRVPVDPSKPVKGRPEHSPLYDPRISSKDPQNPGSGSRLQVPGSRLQKESFGTPMGNTNSPMMRKSPDIIDKALDPDGPDLPVAPSPFPRPGKDYREPDPEGEENLGEKQKKRKKDKYVKRRPGPHLEKGPKRPIDGTGWPRPSGDGAT